MKWKKGKPREPRAETKTSAYGDGKRAGCANAKCKLRKKGCHGFAGCPGWISK